MKIEITDSDIQNGTYGVVKGCPIDLAMTRIGLYVIEVNVNYIIYSISPETPEISVDIPNPVKALMQLYNEGINIPAFNFEI